MGIRERFAIMGGLIFSKERNHGRRYITYLNEKQVADRQAIIAPLEEKPEGQSEVTHGTIRDPGNT